MEISLTASAEFPADRFTVSLVPVSDILNCVESAYVIVAEVLLKDVDIPVIFTTSPILKLLGAVYVEILDAL
jgi:hypothetical protein